MIVPARAVPWPAAFNIQKQRHLGSRRRRARDSGADLVPSPPAGTVPIERHDRRSPQPAVRGPRFGRQGTDGRKIKS